MKYVVTGAAGFIGSHWRRSLLAGGHEVRRGRLLHRLLRPALKEENAAGLDVMRLDLAEEDLDLAGVDGVFHLAGQPGVRSFGDVFEEYVRRNLLASRSECSRRPRRRRPGRLRVVVVDLRRCGAVSDAGGDRAAARSPRTASRSSACEQLAHAYARGFGLDAVVLRYFTFYGPRQRPDMALARIVDALARGSSFELYGDGLQSRSFTYVADGVEATIAAMERAPAGSVYNVGGGEEATMREAIATLERVSGRTLDLVESPSAAGDVRRTSADATRIERDLGWRGDDPARRRLAGPVGMGLG